jgi:hypothetical protein
MDAVESARLAPKDIRTSGVRLRPFLLCDTSAAEFEPDGATVGLTSLPEGRPVFGRQALGVFKVQAGVNVPSGTPDWRITSAPRHLRLSAKLFGQIETTQNLELLSGPLSLYCRTVSLRNSGPGSIRLRVLSYHDPTCAWSRSEGMAVGALGVNAFNRGNHVVMDEASVPNAARVIGFAPTPDAVLMTPDPTKARDLFLAGELPQSTAGASGQVLLVTLHEFELPPQHACELKFTSAYSQSGLEDALKSLGVYASEGAPAPRLLTSDENVNAVFPFAASALASARHLHDRLDSAEALTGLGMVDPLAAESLAARLLEDVRRDGSYPHSSGGPDAGLLEAAVLVSSAARIALLRADKRKARMTYSRIRKCASFLLGLQRSNRLVAGSLPQGWRRHLGRAVPTGELFELDSAAAEAFECTAALASFLHKPSDAARYRQGRVLLEDRLGRRFADERGFPALRFDTDHFDRDPTIDQAVGCYRRPPSKEVSYAVVHRLTERDFETGFGPRTVPTTNTMCFNPSNAEGQTGGYWTRAALAHLLLQYSVGLEGMASLSFQRLCGFLSNDLVSFGAVPGAVPAWVDVERRTLHGPAVDVVAASRLVEAAVSESGFPKGAPAPCFKAAPESKFRWVSLHSFWLGEDSAVFIGRAGGKVYSFLKSRLEGTPTYRFPAYEALQTPSGLVAITFYGEGQYMCVANSRLQTVKAAIAVPPRDQEMSKRLSVGVEALDPVSGSWIQERPARVLREIVLEVTLQPNAWKAFRFTTSK